MRQISLSVAMLVTHHNNDSRKHNGKNNMGGVTAIVMVYEKQSCGLDEYTAKSRLITHVTPKFTTQSRILPVCPVRMHPIFLDIRIPKWVEVLTMRRSGKKREVYSENL